MEIRVIDDEYVWNIPLAKASNSQFLQSWWWGVFQETLGRTTWRLQVVDGDNVVAALQCLSHSLPFGQKYLYAPHGPVFFGSRTDHHDELVQLVGQGLKSIAEKEKFALARLEPTDSHLDVRLVAPFGGRRVASVQPADELAAIVTADEDDLLRAMHDKTRYNIRVATKHGVRARLIEQPDYARRVFPMFWDLLMATAKRQKIRLHAREYYSRMIELFVSKGIMKLLIADFENTIIAAHLLWQFGDTVYFLHGGSDYERRSLMAPFLLHWEGMRLAKKLEKKYYNFGGVAPAGDPHHPWLSLTRFKEGFVKVGVTGEQFHYLGGLDLVFKPFWYTMYSAARRTQKMVRFR